MWILEKTVRKAGRDVGQLFFNPSLGVYEARTTKGNVKQFFSSTIAMVWLKLEIKAEQEKQEKDNDRSQRFGS